MLFIKHVSLIIQAVFGGATMLFSPDILNLLSAMCFGALIGAERQWRQRMAGI